MAEQVLTVFISVLKYPHLLWIARQKKAQVLLKGKPDKLQASG